MSDPISPDPFISSPDRMPGFLDRFQADRGSLERRYAVPYSLSRHERFRNFFAEWRAALEALPFEEMTPGDRADWLLFRHLLERETRRLDREERQSTEMAPLISFAPDLIAL